MDDAGVVDGVNKGLNAFGGSKAKSSPSSNPNINRANNAFPNHSSVDNNPNIPRKNFAKNGLTDEGQEIPGLDNKEGSMRKSFDDIQKDEKVPIVLIILKNLQREKKSLTIRLKMTMTKM